MGIVLAAATLLPAASASAAGSGGKAIKLGTGDDQSAITVHVGDVINVRLKPDANFHFVTPTSSDESVLRQQGSGAANGHHHKVDNGHATFVARSTGTATLESFGTIGCKGHRVCPAERGGGPARLLARRWHVDVTVE